jgi:hypothetical protein
LPACFGFRAASDQQGFLHSNVRRSKGLFANASQILSLATLRPANTTFLNLTGVAFKLSRRHAKV